MLRNTSYGDKRVRAEIDALVGRPFSLIERLKMGGIGSPKLEILDACTGIKKELSKDNNKDLCYGELRPNGIIIYFRSILETWSLAIPIEDLSINQSIGGLRISNRTDWLIIKLTKKNHISAPFFVKCRQLRKT